jgi:hypothetical protein
LFLNKQGQQDALQPSASPQRGPWKRLSVHPSENRTVWLQWFRWNGLVRTVWFEPGSVGMVWLVPAMYVRMLWVKWFCCIGLVTMVSLKMFGWNGSVSWILPVSLANIKQTKNLRKFSKMTQA